ncbi:MAG: hypothetical protein LBU69_03025 [Deltaproteobacteria bacterium]|nr:hypothetical protein [Deltaproteobacteria bacterium]
MPSQNLNVSLAGATVSGQNMPSQNRKISLAGATVSGLQYALSKPQHFPG